MPESVKLSMDEQKLQWLVKELYSHPDHQISWKEMSLAIVIMVFFLVWGFGFLSVKSSWIPEFLSPTYDRVVEVERWEFVALSYTIFYSAFVYSRLWWHVGTKKRALSPGQAVGLTTLLLVPFVFMVTAIVLLAVYIGTDRSHERIYFTYLVCVFAASVAFLALDRALAIADRTVRASQQNALARTFADLPMVISLLILLGFAAIKIFHEHAPEESYRHFVGGALAFQMWVANVVFVLVGGNVFWSFFFRVCTNCVHSPEPDPKGGRKA